VSFFSQFSAAFLGCLLGFCGGLADCCLWVMSYQDFFLCGRKLKVQRYAFLFECFRCFPLFRAVRSCKFPRHACKAPMLSCEFFAALGTPILLILAVLSFRLNFRRCLLRCLLKTKIIPKFLQ
jgi:hypothetical protein